MITPFSTPFTYQALLDQYFGIENNQILVDPEILGKTNETKKVAIATNSNQKN